MTITLPDLPETVRFQPDELRLELACALYARGRLGKVAASELAGVDFFAFQQALQERSVSHYTEEMLAEDLRSLEILFPQ